MGLQTGFKIELALAPALALGAGLVFGLAGCATPRAPAVKPVETGRHKLASTPSAERSNDRSNEQRSFALDRAFFNGARPAPILHHGNGAFSNYVAVELPAPPAAALLASIQSEFDETLSSRGEAHVTAITPPEFHDALASRLAIDDIEKIAEREGLPSAVIEPVCLGSAHAIVESQRATVYFVVVSSADILRFRRAVELEFRARGGDASRFSAEHFYPHVTIGFTHRDLHEEDGVIKGAKSCRANLRLVDGSNN